VNWSTEDFQRYARIFLHWLSGVICAYGSVKPDAAWLTLASGVALEGLTFAWTLYGNRIQAKINEVANLDVVSSVKVNSVAVAVAAPDNVTPTPKATP
jgi:hypothetical protein